MLRDAALFAVGDLGLANTIEERRLAVVDVAEDRDDGLPGDQVLGLVLRLDLFEALDRRVVDVDLFVDLGRRS